MEMDTSFTVVHSHKEKLKASGFASELASIPSFSLRQRREEEEVGSKLINQPVACGVDGRALYQDDELNVTCHLSSQGHECCSKQNDCRRFRHDTVRKLSLSDTIHTPPPAELEIGSFCARK